MLSCPHSTGALSACDWCALRDPFTSRVPAKVTRSNYSLASLFRDALAGGRRAALVTPARFRALPLVSTAPFAPA